ATGIWAKYLPIAYSPGYNIHNKLPYAEHFNLTIQREIAKSAVLSIGYVGSRGRHLLSTVESNPGDPAKCLATPGCDTFGEDTIYDLGGGNFAFGTRPFSVTSGRELDKTTGLVRSISRTTPGKLRPRTQPTTLCRPAWKKRSASSAYWQPIPGPSPSITLPAALTRSTPSIQA